MTNATELPFDLPAVGRKKLTVDFDGGNQSSDAGVLLLRAAESRIGVIAAMAGVNTLAATACRMTAIVTAGGVLFIGSTDDNRFRAIEAKSGKQLWVTKFDRHANASPMTYQGKNGKQYVAIAVTDTLAVFSLP